jgi:DNA-binding response OmpR family regulator
MKSRILLVDDDRDLAETAAEALEAEGFEVITAFDADQGFEMVRRGRPDLIVLDVMMPGRCGFELANELGQTEFASIPVIMLSAVAGPLRDAAKARLGGMECRADAFIGKPLDVEVLLASVRKLLKK